MEENRSRLASSSSLRQDEKIPDDISEIISVTSDPAPNGSNSNITERDAERSKYSKKAYGRHT
ncbi:hypothetical protein Bhyg_10418 [Pseudolycoriella hygida]|uniref:Uncharacterized protein n=1 Tax=Pseudolycoriella hygida TaxID=35572 RepID=A0A9Q0MTH0_9DIPT|nr:hypothetical protein Bhyg_10418 [Pseudolycoriella hygida]